MASRWSDQDAGPDVADAVGPTLNIVAVTARQAALMMRIVRTS
jgi:hypothetical protein